MDDTFPSRLARVRRAVFARHSNPWSAWTRWATAPLLLMARYFARHQQGARSAEAQ